MSDLWLALEERATPEGVAWTREACAAVAADPAAVRALFPAVGRKVAEAPVRGLPGSPHGAGHVAERMPVREGAPDLNPRERVELAAQLGYAPESRLRVAGCSGLLRKLTYELPPLVHLQWLLRPEPRLTRYHRGISLPVKQDAEPLYPSNTAAYQLLAKLPDRVLPRMRVSSGRPVHRRTQGAR